MQCEGATLRLARPAENNPLRKLGVSGEAPETAGGGLGVITWVTESVIR